MKKVLFFLAALTTVVVLEATEHEYVDLGLPSGNKWATMNVGADSVRGIGAFFAQGEVEPDYVTPGKKTGYDRSFDWDHYKWCTEGSITKYCSDPMWGYQGFTDSITILLPEDDAATVLWGENWRTPKVDEYYELMNNCAYDTVTENGVLGMRFTSRVPGFEDKSIFFPYVGLRENDKWLGYEEQKIALYMTSTVGDKHSDFFGFPNDQGIYISMVYRCTGANVRAIYDEPEEHRPAIDLGLNVLWSVANVKASGFDEPGGYFAWGSIVHESGEPVTWDTYIFGTEDHLTKYNTKTECGTVDNKTTLDPADDVATAWWGGDWRMPDTTDWKELREKCHWKWVTTSSWQGYMITSQVPGYEQASIFLPSTGYKEDIFINNGTTDFYYFTPSLNTANPNKAFSVTFAEDIPFTIQSDFRHYGFACRPVKTKTQPSTELEQMPFGQKSGKAEGLIGRKVIRNGQLIIERNGRRYTALGTRKI